MASDAPHSAELAADGSPATAQEGGVKRAGPGQPVTCSPAELEDFLSGACQTIFEDAEDEVHYLRRRGDALAQEVQKARGEIKRLHEAGLRLQDAYIALQKEYREVAGDAVYWKALAEAREEELTASQAQEPVLADVEPNGKSVAKDKKDEDEKLNPREALRRAASDAAQAEAVRRRKLAQQRAEEAAAQLLQNSVAAGHGDDHGNREATSEEVEVGQNSVGSQEVGQSSVGSAYTPRRPRSAWGEVRGRATPDLSRTPPRSRSESGCSSPCSSRSFKTSVSSSSSCIASRAAALPAPHTKWGIGSSPKRCPGMGTPIRRQAQAAHSGYTSQGASPMRASASTPERAAVPKPGHGKIASLVSLWERKKPSSSEASVRSSQGMLSVASPARPAARPPMPTRPGETTEDKRRAELARVIGLSP